MQHINSFKLLLKRSNNCLWDNNSNWKDRALIVILNSKWTSGLVLSSWIVRNRHLILQLSRKIMLQA